MRARIVLLAARGWGVAPSARHLQVTVSTVRKWRGRFATSGLDGFRDRQRSGRPCRFDGLVRSALFSLACWPVPEDLYRNHWTADELQRELLAADVVSNISVGKHEDWKHLRVKARGRSLLIVADEQDDPDPLARLEPIGPGRYGLCITWHNRKWQRMPVAAGLADLVKILRLDFDPLLNAW